MAVVPQLKLGGTLRENRSAYFLSSGPICLVRFVVILEVECIAAESIN